MNFILVVFALCFCCAASEDNIEDLYSNKANCKPENVIKKNVSCEALGASVPIGGGLYSNWEMHYNLMLSPYYAARMADALGYSNCCPGNNSTFLNGMNLMTPWSGIHGGIAVDGVYGYDRLILRRCRFPDDTYPFLCTGSAGIPKTRGENLGTLSYISLLHDNDNHRWTLFGQCWNAKTPENPNAKPIATSFNVFSLDPKFDPKTEARDRKAIIDKLKSIGFPVDDIIEPDYTGSPVSPKC